MRLENSYLSQPLVSPLLEIHKLASETETYERQNQERETVIPQQDAETGSGGFESLLNRAQLRQHEQQQQQQQAAEGAVSQQPSPSSEKSEQQSLTTSESSPVLDVDVEYELREKMRPEVAANIGEKKFPSHPESMIPPCATDASRDGGALGEKPNGLDEFHLAVRRRRVQFENSFPSTDVACSIERRVADDQCAQSNQDPDTRFMASPLKEVTASQHQEKHSLHVAGDDRGEAMRPEALGQLSKTSARPQQLKPMTNAQLRLEILQQKLREQREKAERECAELLRHGASVARPTDARSQSPVCGSCSAATSVAEFDSRNKKSAEKELKELETKLKVDLEVYLAPLVRSQKNKHDLRYVPETELLESFSSPECANFSCQCTCATCSSSGKGITKSVQFRLDHQKDTNCRDNRQANCVLSIPTSSVDESTSKYDRKNLYLHLNSNHNNNNECPDKNKATSVRKDIYWNNQNSSIAKEINYGKQNLWQTDDGSDKKTSSSSEGSLHSLNFSKKTCSPVFAASKFLPGCSSPATEKFPCLNSTAAKTEGFAPVVNGCEGGGLDYVRLRQKGAYSPRLFRCDCANCIEIEASESCKWLRAAGFPQYAQMYEELGFPLDLTIAERDHSFLEPESLNALFRRLKILNRCARIRLDHQAPNKAEESEDEEQQCALSSNWLFERHSGRWSRVGTELEVNKMLDVEPPPFKRSGSERIKDSAKALLRRMESMKAKKKRKPHREGGSLHISRPILSSAAAIENRVAELDCIDLQQGSGTTDAVSRGVTAPRHRSLSRHAHSQGEDSSSLTSDQSQNSTPLFRSRRRKRFLSSKDDECARGGGDHHSDVSGGKSAHSGQSSSRSGESGKSCDSRGSDAGAAFSDSECSLPTYRSRTTPGDDDKVALRGKLSSGGSEDSYCRHTPLQHSSSVNIPHGLSGTPPTKEQMLINNRNKMDKRGSPPPSLDDERHSIYDNVPIIICNKAYQDFRQDVTMDSASTSAREGSGSSECCTADSRGSPCPSNAEQDVATLLTPASSQHLDVHRPKRKNTVERWHSFNDGNKRSSTGDEGMHISHFSAGQMLILKKRALLRLTALMEHHCPSRPTWNWELPKFMTKRFRPSDNKTTSNLSSQVFGVALHATQRKTGYPLPPVITDALRYLDQSCSDQIGLFRKPGVRSRIQKLRELIDQGEVVDFTTYGAYDVADMVKTYFRELPEVLLTNKISEVFLAIFHYLPEADRMEAMQCGLLMLPDENREALMTLLTFLDKMASNSHLNQMTASNLAVCLAPSLFHLCVGGSGVSPLRRKNVSGSPEQKDLNDNKAAHVCLQMMIQKVHLIDFIGADMLSQISFTYLETSQPVHVEDLGMTSSFSSAPSTPLAEAGDGSCSPQHSSDWAAYMDSCIAALVKEVKEKNRAYVSLSSPDPDVEVIYRKVGDGHPLRLWKVTTEVEAPPAELLNRVLQERHLWDDTLAKWRTIARLDRQSDVWQYLTKSMLPKPSNDFCVLRCWRSDMGRVGGSCALVETSVEHPDARLVDGCTRGIVLVSRYYIQPCGSGKSRVTHISRIDLRGRSPEWYNKNYGALAARKLAKLRDSFKHFAEGPESKV